MPTNPPASSSVQSGGVPSELEMLGALTWMRDEADKQSEHARAERKSGNAAPWDDYATVARWLLANVATVSALRERVGALEDANGLLLRFAGEAFKAARGEWLGCDWDGGDLQDAMFASGLLTRVSVTTACGEDCQCGEVGFPTTCLRPSPLGLAAIDAARSASSTPSEGNPT